MLTFLAAAPRRTQSSWFLRAFAHFGGLGLVPLAVLDSSIIPTFGSLDILAAFLAARHADVWPYYAAMATIGAMIGAYITYKIGQRTGRGWMERRVGAHRSRQVAYILERWGFGAIFVSTVAPPPCPTALFFLAAGAFDYHMKKFMTAVFTGASDSLHSADARVRHLWTPYPSLRAPSAAVFVAVAPADVVNSRYGLRVHSSGQNA